METSNGNVVVIEKGLKLTYDISHQARLVDSDSYGIQGLEAFDGFISGICAGNYDVTDIFVDSTLKIIGQDMKALEELIERMNKLSKEANVNIVLLVSADKSELPRGDRKPRNADLSIPCRRYRRRSCGAGGIFAYILCIFEIFTDKLY